MKPQAFQSIWTESGDPLSPITPSRLVKFNLQKETTDFLVTAGLPESAAPFLSFIKDSDDKYDGINDLVSQYDFLEQEYQKFIVIGSDGSGDIIAIDTANNDEVVWLDHEDYFSNRFMNSSINQLADFLVIYRDFITYMLDENGEEAYLNSDFTDEQYLSLQKIMMDSDSRALTEEGFWKDELQNLLANREEYLNE